MLNRLRRWFARDEIQALEQQNQILKTRITIRTVDNNRLRSQVANLEMQARIRGKIDRRLALGQPPVDNWVNQLKPNTTPSIQGGPDMGANFPGKGDLYWHVHHTVLAEALTEPLQNRLDFIEQNKPKEQRAWRLHSINRVTDDPGWPTTLAALREAGTSAGFTGIQKEDLETLHAKQCFKNCPWDGKNLLTNAAGVRNDRDF